MKGAVAIGAALAFCGSATAAPTTPVYPDTTPPEISSGGDRARHVCFAEAAVIQPESGPRPIVAQPGPCTSEFRPLALSRDDRVAVRVPASAVAVALLAPGGDRTVCVARGDGLWGCAMPAADKNARQLTVSIGYPGADLRWTFDALVLPRAQRATDQVEKVRFRLAGRHLRVQMLSGTIVADDLWGKRVKVACVSRNWLSARPLFPVAREHYVVERFRWLQEATTHSVFFGRSLHRNAYSCVIEPARSGADIAGVFFPRRR